MPFQSKPASRARSALLIGAAIGWFARLPQRMVDEASGRGGFPVTALGFLAGALVLAVANVIISRSGTKHRIGSGKQQDEENGSGLAAGGHLPVECAREAIEQCRNAQIGQVARIRLRSVERHRHRLGNYGVHAIEARRLTYTLRVAAERITPFPNGKRPATRRNGTQMTIILGPEQRLHAVFAAAGQALYALGTTPAAASHFIGAQKHLRWLIQRAQLEHWDVLDAYGLDAAEPAHGSQVIDFPERRLRSAG